MALIGLKKKFMLTTGRVIFHLMKLDSRCNYSVFAKKDSVQFACRLYKRIPKYCDRIGSPWRMLVLIEHNFVTSCSVKNEENGIYATSTPIGKLQTKMLLSFKCKICETRVTKLISKVSYEKGVVIVRCGTCNNNHLIADNLNWFTDLNGMRNIEEILAAKGESVQRLATTDSVEIISKETEHIS